MSKLRRSVKVVAKEVCRRNSGRTEKKRVSFTLLYVPGLDQERPLRKVALGLSLECQACIHKVDGGGNFCRGSSMLSIQVGNTLMRFRTPESCCVQVGRLMCNTALQGTTPLTSVRMAPLPPSTSKAMPLTTRTTSYGRPECQCSVSVLQNKVCS